MKKKSKVIIWLASYPRSGNTLLRTILWNCFGLPSMSIYTDDLDGNKALAEYIGHVENGKVPESGEVIPSIDLPLVKTHAHPVNNNPAIYVIRDGRDACLSLSRFWGGLTKEEVIEGEHNFGSWSDHVNSWNPWDRPNTLLLKYEDMVANLPATLKKIELFLDVEIVSSEIPDRKSIANVGGIHVNSKPKNKSILSEQNIKRFNELHGDTLKKAGY